MILGPSMEGQRKYFSVSVAAVMFAIITYISTLLAIHISINYIYV